MTKAKANSANSKVQKHPVNSANNAKRSGQDPHCLNKGDHSGKTPFSDTDSTAQLAHESWKDFESKYIGKTVFLDGSKK